MVILSYYLIRRVGDTVEENRIKIARMRKGLTQDQLGKLVGVSGVALMRYEKNQRQPKQKIIHKLSKVLDVNEAWLMGYDVPMERTENNLNDSIKVKTKNFEYFIKYLESIGYTVEIEPEVLEWHYEDVIENGKVIGRTQIADKETYTVKIIKDKTTTIFTESEFEEFRKTIEKSVEFEIYKANQNK